MTGSVLRAYRAGEAVVHWEFMSPVRARHPESVRYTHAGEGARATLRTELR